MTQRDLQLCLAFILLSQLKDLVLVNQVGEDYWSDDFDTSMNCVDQARCLKTQDKK